MPFLITFGKAKVFCVPASQLHVPPLYYQETCYMEYDLALNWPYIASVIVVALIFIPCLIGAVIYYGLMIYLRYKESRMSGERSRLL